MKNDKKFKVNRKMEVNGREISVRFYYGEPNETNPELSYTKVIELTHGPNKGKHYCRFVECRIEELTNDGWKPIVIGESICGPTDRFNKIQGRARALARAVEKLGVDENTSRKIRIYGIGNVESIKRYNKRHGILIEEESEAVET